MQPPDTLTDSSLAKQSLDIFYRQINDIILSRQHPITGLLPASTAINVHGNYTDAWVRDNVYSILAPWALALAYRKQKIDPHRRIQLEQSVVKLMRGLLTAMMKQADKVERFKATQDPIDCLHAKYDTATGNRVVGDQEWGHLQLDATSLFLLMLAQMTAGGLRIVFDTAEVNFVQNLVYYIGRAYRTRDYGIWERGNKLNHGIVELNASSVGMAKSALEALKSINLFSVDQPEAGRIHIIPDELAHMRTTLDNLLPRESGSKETDAALLSIISYPAFAVNNEELVEQTRAIIVKKLLGRYGCKRFLRDGHQTQLEDISRLHYDADELKHFESIESEWPLFLVYLLLDAQFRRDDDAVQQYSQAISRTLVNVDNVDYLPELYYVPAESISAEKAQPGSQVRKPNDNIPLIWAQSLYYVTQLIQQQLLQPEDVDPLILHKRREFEINPQLHVAVIAENEHVKNRLHAHNISSDTVDEIQPMRVYHADALIDIFGEIGRNDALKISGRPARRMRSLTTCRAYEINDETTLFAPDAMKPFGFYLTWDNRLLVERLKGMMLYVHRYWSNIRQPLITMLVTERHLHNTGAETLLRFIESLQAGLVKDVPVRCDTVANLLPHVMFERITLERKPELSTPFESLHDISCYVMGHDPRHATPLSYEQLLNLELLETVNDKLGQLANSTNVYEQIELVASLCHSVHGNINAEFELAGQRITLRQMLEDIYIRAGETKRWDVVRWCAGLLGICDERLEDLVVNVLAHQKRLSVGLGYSEDALIDAPLDNATIMQKIRTNGGDDVRKHVMIQEIVIYIGVAIRAHPEWFKDILTVRAGYILNLIISRLSQQYRLPLNEAFSSLLGLGPLSVQMLIMEAFSSYTEMEHFLVEQQALHTTSLNGGFIQLEFPESHYPENITDWHLWRAHHGGVLRLSTEFFANVWSILHQCKGLIVGDPLDERNCLGSHLVNEQTSHEKNFALHVEHLLNKIHASDYRQLIVETLNTLHAIFRANPKIRVDGHIVLDTLLGNAVRLKWLMNQDPGSEKAYHDHSPEAWEDMYDSKPHELSNAVMKAFLYLTGIEQKSHMRRMAINELHGQEDSISLLQLKLAEQENVT